MQLQGSFSLEAGNIAALETRKRKDYDVPIERLRDEALKERIRATTGAAPEDKDPPGLQGTSKMARPGLEPGTPRFSVVCSTN